MYRAKRPGGCTESQLYAGDLIEWRPCEEIAQRNSSSAKMRSAGINHVTAGVCSKGAKVAVVVGHLKALHPRDRAARTD